MLALVVGAALLLMAGLAPETVKGASEDLIDLVDRLGTAVVAAIIGIFQLLTIGVTLTVTAVLISRRRWGILLVLMVAALAAAVAVALLGSWLDEAVPQATVDRNATGSFITGAAFPSVAFLAAASAVVTAGAPSLTRSWRIMTWLAIASLVLSRVITSTVTPVHAAAAVAIGSAVGSLTLLVFGAPVRKARLSDLGTALASFGVDTTAVVRAEVGASHSSTFRAVGGDGSLFVKVIGRDERDEVLLSRTYRAIRVKGIEDRVPYTSASEAVHAEAMSLALAARDGVRAPQLAAVGSSRDGWAFLVATEIEGTRLDDLDPGTITDNLLDDVWRQVALLQARRTAHRWLNTHHVMVTPGGDACLLDFRWAVHGADGGTLGADVGELLTSLSLVVGTERALAAAGRMLSHEQLARALPYLQPRALSEDTQRQLKQHTDLLEPLRSGLQEATGLEEYELADLQRVSAWGVMLLFGTGVLIAFALALVANIGDIIDAFREAEWWWCVAVLALSAATYPSGALSLIGAVPRQLPFVLTTTVMLGQSFLNRFTPANAGGMALRVRYVQVQGVDLTGSAAAVGLTSAASGVMQVVLLVLFFVWAGQTDELSFDAPKFNIVALAIGVAGVAALVIWFTPWGRRVLKPLLYTTVDRVWKQVTEIARNPVKMLLLFGGAAASKLVTILAFWASMRAFGVEESIPRTAVLYLVATTIASAVPTPGGVGAVEAALIAGLTGIGVDPGVAFSIVIIFRVGTYWLPVPFGYIAYGYVQRIKAV